MIPIEQCIQLKDGGISKSTLFNLVGFTGHDCSCQKLATFVACSCFILIFSRSANSFLALFFRWAMKKSFVISCAPPVAKIWHRALMPWTAGQSTLLNVFLSALSFLADESWLLIVSHWIHPCWSMHGWLGHSPALEPSKAMWLTSSQATAHQMGWRTWWRLRKMQVP